MLRDATGGTPADDLSAAFEQHRVAVYRVCRRWTRTAEDAADALQETFLRFLEADRARIDNVEAWLVGVAKRVCWRQLQRRDQHAETELDDSRLATSAGDPADSAVDAAWLADVARRLRPLDFQVLHMLYVTGLSIDQVAEHLGVTVGNVRIMAFRARNRVRELHDMFGIGIDLMLFFNPLIALLIGSQPLLPDPPGTVIRQRRPLRSPPGCRVVRHRRQHRRDASSQAPTWQRDELR